MDIKHKRALQIGINIFFICIVICMFFISSKYAFVKGIHLGARTFPVIVGVLILLFGTVNIIVTIYKIKNENESITKEEPELEPSNSFNKYVRKYRVGISIGLMALYYIFLSLFGFVIATALFLVSILYVMEYRKPVPVTLVTILGVGLIYISFKVLLGVPLPTGLLF